MGEGIGFGLHRCGNGGPADTLQVAFLDDGQEQVLVGFVVPLGRHVVVCSGVKSLRGGARRMYVVCCEVGCG